LDEARVIPLHGTEPAGPLRRGRRLANRRTGRPTPGPGNPGASIHPLTPTPTESSAPPADRARPEPVGPAVRVVPAWEQRAAQALSFLGRRLQGNYAVDEFGFDADLTENAILPVLRPLYDKWFRVDVNGVEHIPAEGGALLVANHAGGLWALDATMTAFAVHTEHPSHRFLRMLGADLVFNAPVLGPLARKSGSTLACSADAERLLAAGELVGVWPEGFKGIGKPFHERYKLQRFGRGGFVHAAIKTGVPIIPVSIIGSEEIHPVLGNAKTVARILNLPYFPLTPTFPWLGPLGLLPLPSKWYIEFGEPIHTEDLDPEAAEDAVTVFDVTDRVRETIQSTLYRLLVQRRSIWR
jgi:1-acyl-sn-glycerol-3-phosphate acyltransferase